MYEVFGVLNTSTSYNFLEPAYFKEFIRALSNDASNFPKIFFSYVHYYQWTCTLNSYPRFQAAIRKYGVPDEEIFQTADLFERRNIRQVTLCILALARVTQLHPEYEGPSLGPKMATENQRNFTEEQTRRMRDAQIGLQAGQASMASQAGHGGMGNTRHM